MSPEQVQGRALDLRTDKEVTGGEPAHDTAFLPN